MCWVNDETESKAMELNGTSETVVEFLLSKLSTDDGLYV